MKMVTGEKGFDLGPAARHLLDGHQHKTLFKPFAGDFGIDDLDKAYAVQDLFVAGLGAGGPRSGYKVGLTSKAMQAMVDLDQPIGGIVFADGTTNSPANLSKAHFGRLGLEFEIAVRLAKDIGAGDLPLNRDSIGSYVAGIAPAFEVIDDRGADYSDLEIFSIIADNSWNSGAVLGEMQPVAGDLATVTGTLKVNGEIVGTGKGSDVLGHPFEPLIWLANHLVARGGTLKAGDIVLTGSLLPSRFPEVGDIYEFMVEGMGGVTATIIA